MFLRHVDEQIKRISDPDDTWVAPTIITCYITIGKSSYIFKPLPHALRKPDVTS